MESIKRIHHISAIVGDPKENVRFYETILKMRLVKQTVNFDEPETYHLYYGNDLAEPGTLITFFPWPTTSRGRVGSGQVGQIAFRIPKGSVGYWNERLTSFDVNFEISQLFGQTTMELEDFHGLAIALVESEEETEGNRIIGFHGTVLLSSQPKDTMKTLRDDLGLTLLSEDAINFHLETAGAEKHHIIVPKEKLPRGRFGVGTVHHVAWSVPNDETHREWQDYLFEEKYSVTEIKNRQYFQAIYFVEKGNVVFEIATDGPGFTINESLETLGQNLMLPPQYEHMRDTLVENLLPLRDEVAVSDFN
ncbi:MULTISPECIES: VOC family protein [Vagococcus]|uniref:Glyoxalase family protein n=1 Tax=Vagococcus fluvialis bH819 TaxID=1255619 RepID=A0A1X6WSJ1_9ENTE|nr:MULTISPECIES: VOC family protein [Vagococcus]SLM87237.1 Glyoxalase family protein [Vagococcus fluvialis bH819]HCM89097.1 ring-cleaving dioxygenase [Vagococcus sp.]